MKHHFVSVKWLIFCTWDYNNFCYLTITLYILWIIYESLIVFIVNTNIQIMLNKLECHKDNEEQKNNSLLKQC